MLVAEFEVFDDVLGVLGEAVQVVFKVGEELLLVAAGFEVAQGEPGGVVEGLPGGVAEGGVLGSDAGGVEHLAGFDYGG